jgi:hypothetical protein
LHDLRTQPLSLKIRVNSDIDYLEITSTVANYTPHGYKPVVNANAGCEQRVWQSLTGSLYRLWAQPCGFPQGNVLIGRRYLRMNFLRPHFQTAKPFIIV